MFLLLLIVISLPEVNTLYGLVSFFNDGRFTVCACETKNKNDNAETVKSRRAENANIEYNNFLKELVCLRSSGGREIVNDKNHAKLQTGIKNFVMTIQQAQQQVDGWIKTTGVRYFSELTNMAILTEEVGELARIMARQYGDQSFKESDKDRNLADEMADVMWVLLCLANQTGVDLTDALEKNFEKKTKRDAERHKQNEKLK
jgi:NTP pyrophosphatase (non-canonical NTP hydrolase)